MNTAKIEPSETPAGAMAPAHNSDPATDAMHLIEGRAKAAPAPDPDEDELAERPSRLLKALPLLGALLVGLLLGGLIARQMHKSHQVVAAVNGATITQDMLFNRLQVAGGPQVIHRMVAEELELQYSAKKGVAPTDAQVEDKYAELSADPNFAQELAGSGESPDDFKRDLRIKLSQINVITQGVTVTNAEVQRFYAEQSNPHNPQAQFYKPAAVSLRVIATNTRAQAVKAAQDLAIDTPFEVVVNNYSVDPSRDNEGLLPPLVQGRSPLSHAPALEQAIFHLQIKQMMGPVSYQNRWWLFRCEDVVPAHTLSFESVKAQAILGAKVEKGTTLNGARIQSEFVAFQKSSALQSFWPQYEQAVSGK